MSKFKTSTSKIGRYLREISVVVIGVAITLSASYWVTSRSEKKGHDPLFERHKVRDGSQHQTY
jgi:hypothetical protein